MSRFQSQRFGIQKAAVKRLCRDEETLLSRPGRGAACASPIPLSMAIFQSAAERFKAAQRSGFRDVHASKGSNRA